MSATMLEGLRRIEAGRPLFEGCVSRCSYRGRAGTLKGLRNHGLIELEFRPRYSARLTDAGRAVLAENA